MYLSRPSWELTAGAAGASKRLLGWKFLPPIKQTLSSRCRRQEKNLLVRWVVCICLRPIMSWTISRTSPEQQTLQLPMRGMCWT